MTSFCTKKNSSKNRRNLLILGEQQVGKTSLLLALTQSKDFPKFNLNPSTLTLNNQDELSTFQNLGQNRLNPDIVILMFDSTNTENLITATSTWFPLIQKYFPDTPTLLCGNKADMPTTRHKLSRRCSRRNNPVLLEAIIIQSGVNDYVDISCKYQRNFDILVKKISRLLGVSTCVHDDVKVPILQKLLNSTSNINGRNDASKHKYSLI